MSSDSLPMQTQDDRAPMTDATLTSHGLCRGGSRNIKGQKWRVQTSLSNRGLQHGFFG